MADPRDLSTLPQSVRQHLVEVLARRSAGEPGSRRRGAVRYPLRCEDFAVSVGEADTFVRALSHDISNGGLSFFYGVFIHPGTSCVAQLRTTDGERVLVPGKVVRCTFVQGRVHEVGVEFDAAVDAGMFSKEAACSDSTAPHKTATDDNAPKDWARIESMALRLGAAIKGRDLDSTVSIIREIDALFPWARSA